MALKSRAVRGAWLKGYRCEDALCAIPTQPAAATFNKLIIDAVYVYRLCELL